MSNHDAKPENAETCHKLEQQFILRLPKVITNISQQFSLKNHLVFQEISQDIRLSLKTETKLIKKQLKLKMDPETKYGYLIFKGNVVPLKLVDLPTLTESSKTIDGKFLFKTADVHQMMVAYELEENNNEPGPGRQFQWPHGLTAPLKNVKKNRFRKTLRNKACHGQQLAKEIRRLLKIDSEAVSRKKF